MDDLLTAQQVQNILKVNRITIYRMLQDGRLKGVKIGQQWRFPAGQFEKLVSGEHMQEGGCLEEAAGGLPVHCIQAIQDLYADLGSIGTIIIDREGNPITEISSPCELCVLMNTSEAGRKACERSWRESLNSTKKSPWFVCHAGLHYMKVPIMQNEKPVAYLLTGQFYFEQPEILKQEEKIKQWVEAYHVNGEALVQAAATVPVYDAERRMRMESWPARFTQAVEAMMNERSDLVERLQKIVKISTL